MTKRTEDKSVSRGRHEFSCRICKHERREEIERLFVTWESPRRIAKTFRLSKDSVYRHAHALDLFSKRRVNIRTALERIIEQSSEVEVNAAAVVAAVGAYARINSSGQWVEKRETVDMGALFERMTSAELDKYVRDGSLPAWFPGATVVKGQGDGNES